MFTAALLQKDTYTPMFTAALLQKDTYTPMFTAALLTRKQLKCPLTDEWINKMWYIYAMEY